MSSSNDSRYGLNTIFYGPPGTGKTREAMRAAVEIIGGPSWKDRDDRSVMGEYRKLCEGGRIRFVTFHQSYGYEEFVEGIRPVMGSDDSGDIKYEVVDGAFKEFCGNCGFCDGGYESDESSASDDIDYIRDDSRIWKVSLGGSGDNPIRTECLKNKCIRVSSKGDDNPSLENFSKMQEMDVVLSMYNKETIDAIGVVEGECKRNDVLTTHEYVRKVNWIVTFDKDKLPNVKSFNNEKLLKPPAVRPLPNADVERLREITRERLMEITSDSRPKSTKGNFVFIIDEINRGNISSVFGELITLIEPAKRAGRDESMSVKLPYSREEFSVPDNVYIIGTMNTADRSLVSMDVALRRRFDFIEVMPDPELIKDNVEGINLKSLFETVNGRIEALYDREHMLGHSYFMNVESVDGLKAVFKNNVIPLLRDYFHEDYGKIIRVLSNKSDHDKSPFIIEEESECFDDHGGKLGTYRVDDKNLDKADCYISIYKDKR